MSLVDLLTELGGVARRADLLRVVDRGELDRLSATGDVVRDARGRYALPPHRVEATVHVTELRTHDVADGVTSAEIRLRDCLRHLPYDEALAVADSALREGAGAELRQVADLVRGPGSAQVRRVAERATALAANPFESVLRALCHRVPGLAVHPRSGCSVTPRFGPTSLTRASGSSSRRTRSPGTAAAAH